MKKNSSFLLCFSLILLFSCTGGFFGSKEEPAKPYYFSTLKHKPAFHASKPLTPKMFSDSVASSTEYKNTASRSFSDFTAEENKKADFKGAVVQARPEKPTQNSPRSEGQKHSRDKVTVTEQKKTDNWFLAAAALFSVLTASVFSLFIPRAKSLASWAKEHKKAARFTIAAGHLLIGFGGYFIGRKLADYGVATTEVSTYSLLGFAGIAALAYPDKNQNGWVKYTFRRNRILSFLVLLSGFFLFLNIGNREVTDKDFNPTTKQISEAAGSNLYADWQENINPESGKYSKDAGDVLLDILLLVVMLIGILLILWGIAAIACALACSGHLAVAVIVLLGGFTLTGFLLAGAIRVISNRVKKRRGEILQEKKEKRQKNYQWF